MYKVKRFSKAAKIVYGSVPKSLRSTKLARKVINADKSLGKLSYDLSTNPGKFVGDGVKLVSENPVTASVPGALTIGTPLATSIKKKPSTIDSLLKDTKLGKPIYSATGYLGKKLAPISESVTNAAYNSLKSI